ncbi:MAG: hypothetical protein E7413_02215 [Ruminococcaceae bacterium]|nr:hypothetical protein [Oscillospiraceae bacterium]
MKTKKNIKKLLCLLTALTLLLGVFSALAATASDLGSVSFYNEGGEVITALDGCDTVTANITFTPTEKNSAQVIVSHYTADGVLCKTEPITTVSAVAGEENQYSREISVADTELLKVFCWEGTDSLVPLTNPGIIERDLLEELPTATVTEIEAEDADFALNFTADEVTDEQLAFYGDWKADFVFKMNKDATFNADGTRDGYLIGQYDEFGPEFVKIPATDLAVTANTPVSIMDAAGLTVTYRDVAETVKDFDCGVNFSHDFLKENDGLEVSLALVLVNPENGNIYTIAEKDFEFCLPTATVTELDVEAIQDVDLTFALNFKADPSTESQLAVFGDWYADYEIMINKTATFHSDGTCDGYLAGQYDSWSPAWVSVPKMAITLTPGTPLKIMETAAEAYGKPGLKYTYQEVYERVKDFDCGIFFAPEFLVANPDLEVTLALKMYNPNNEDESYVIGRTYTFTPKNIPSIDKFIGKDVTYTHTLETAEANTVTYDFAELFTVIDGVPVDMDNLTVTGATYEDGTITVDGFGKKTITVTDNYYCNVATATVTVNEPANIDKWNATNKEITLTVDTVGKDQTVNFADLFTAIDGAIIKTVEVTVDNGGTYADGVITVPGTIGTYTVTVTDNFYCNEATAIIVVNDAANVDKFIGKDIEVTHTLATIESGKYTVDFADLFDTNGYEVKEITVTGGTYADGKVTVEGLGTITVTATDNFYCNVATATVTVKEPAAVDKWTAKSDLAYETEQGVAVTKTLGELFSANGNLIKDATVSVTGASSFTKDATWDNGIVTFSGGGTYTVTITDGFYCTATSATVTVTELAPPQIAKFDTKFVNHEDYLYRIGNQNTVALGSIFKALDGVSVGTVNVAVEPLANTPLVSATYTKNTDWTKSTLKFSGTGVVKVTISDEESTPYSLYLEIVDAKNVTTATSATANNVVLLNDISGTFNVSNGYAFYGNGFTVTCAGKGNPGLKLLTTGFINVSKGGILDNTRIICDIFPESYLYTSDASGYDYFKSAVLLTDDSTISNCYIYGARCNIFIGGGNATVKNTVTECGSFANIQIVRSSDEFTVTLEDVTTIQYMTTSSYDTSKNVMGLGIAVGDADTKSNPYIRLKGDLRQYNWVTSDHSSVSNSYAKSVLEVALKESAYQHTINGKNTVNLGMAYITSYPANIIDERTNKAEIPYALNKVSFLGATGRVYTVAAGSAVTADYRYNPETDGVIPYICGGNGLYEPQIYPNSTLGGQYIANTDGCNKYCYMDSDTLKVMIPAGESFEIDFTKIFDINKYSGQDLQTQITCTDENGDEVSLTNGKLTLSETKEYIVTYTLTDTIFYNENGESVAQTVVYTKKLPVSVALKDTSTPNAEFSFDSTKQVIYYNKALLGDKIQFMPFLAGLKIYDYMGDTRYLRFDGDDNAYQKVVSATIENLNTTGEAKGYHIITVKLVDGGVLKIDLDVKATAGGSTHSGSIKTNKNIFYVVNDGGTASSGQIWRVYDYEFTGNNGVVINSGSVNFGKSGVDATSFTKPTGTFSATVSATVTYDANGGLCGQSVGYQTNHYNTLTLPNPTRYGYVFAGWYDAPYQGNRVGGAGDLYTPGGDVTLYAQWGKPCTVTLDATGGSVTPETINYNGEQIVLPLPEKSGYWFTGWYEDAACTKLYGLNGVILNPTKNTTFYAGWSPVYTVTYNPTGGNVTPTSMDYVGTVLTLPLPSDTARAFAGWYTEENGGTFIGMGNDTYLPTAHITLYAHWEAPSVVTYDANGGSCSTDSQTYMGAPLTLPTPTLTGYTFQGWFTQAEGGTKIGGAGASYTPDESITLYAQWVKTPYTITVSQSNATVTGVTNGQTAYYGDSFTVTVSFSQNNSKSLKVTDGNGNTLLSESTAGTYTFSMPASNVTVSASSSGGCFSEDTLITMADGTKKAIKEITTEDSILTYNFFTGEMEAKDVALVVNHGVAEYPVANLTFSDGTVLKVIEDHGVFDYDLNQYVYLTMDNMAEYIGHTFVKMHEDGYTTVTLDKAEKTTETIGAYSLTSAGNFNALAEGLLTVAPPDDLYNWMPMGEKLRYDTDAFQNDIESYGLYTYDDFSQYVTYEQFIELNGAYLKIPVEKGIFSWDYILELIDLYVK